MGDQGRRRGEREGTSWQNLYRGNTESSSEVSEEILNQETRRRVSRPQRSLSARGTALSMTIKVDIGGVPMLFVVHEGGASTYLQIGDEVREHGRHVRFDHPGSLGDSHQPSSVRSHL